MAPEPQIATFLGHAGIEVERCDGVVRHRRKLVIVPRTYELSDIVVGVQGKCAAARPTESATNISLTVLRTGQPQFNALFVKLALQRVE